MKIEDARKAATEFLRETVHREGTVIKLSKTHEGWKVQVEVIEASESVRSLAIPAKVMERNVYQVTLDGELEVELELTSCERVGQRLVAGEAS